MIKLLHGDCLELMQTNRKFIGIEKEEEYFNIAQQRINSILL